MTPSGEIEDWRSRVTQAALGFEARWTEARLWAVDQDLARRLVQQRDLFRAACDGGKLGDVAKHGAAMCRGYAAVTKALEDAGAEPNAYQVGQCLHSGITVFIGHKAVVTQLPDSNKAIWISPDEVAILLGRVAALKPLRYAKQRWKGCEVTYDALARAGMLDQPINQFDQPIPADDEAEQDT